MLAKEPPYKSSPTPSKSKEEVKKVIKTHIASSIKAINETLLVLSNYGLLPETTKASQKPINVIEFLKTIPEESLKMKRVVKVRGGEKEVTLKDELEGVVEEYKESIKSARPDITPALSLPFVETNGEGKLLMGGDMVVDPDTVYGGILVCLLNAQAKGENIREVIDGINEAVDEVVSNYSASTNIEGMRGLYKADVPLWNKGVIPYTYDSSVSSELRALVEQGMRDWEEKVGGGIIDFIYDDNWWTTFLWSIGFGKKLIIKQDDNNKGGKFGGEATVGSECGAIMKLGSEADIGVVRHELGHVLGLKHEHQRDDRDNYIEVKWENIPNDWKSAYEKIPFYKTEMRSYWVLVGVMVIIIPIPWFPYFVPIPIPIFEERFYQVQVPASYAPTPYDFFSIMHYAGDCRLGNPDLGPELLSKCYVTNTNFILRPGMIIPGNTEITEYDAETVRKMYRK